MDINVLHVPPSVIHHFYKMVREGSMTETEFGKVWNESIEHSIWIYSSSLSKSNPQNEILSEEDWKAIFSSEPSPEELELMELESRVINYDSEDS